MPAEPQLIYCPQCGYDLRGQHAERCPECGLHYDTAALRQISDHALVLVVNPLLDALPLALVSPFLSMTAALTGWLTSGRGFGFCFPLGLLLAGLYMATLSSIREWILRRPGQRYLSFSASLKESIPLLLLSWRGIPVAGFMLSFAAIPLALLALIVAGCWAGLSESRRMSGSVCHALKSLPASDLRILRTARNAVAGLLLISVPLLVLAAVVNR